jgi:hypothetical protein
MRERFYCHLKYGDISLLESTKYIGKSRERIFLEIFVGLNREVLILVFSETRRSHDRVFVLKRYIIFLISYDDLSIRVDRGDSLIDSREEISVSDEEKKYLSFFIDNFVGKLDVIEDEIECCILERSTGDLPYRVMHETHDTGFFFENFLCLMFFIQLGV